MDVLVDRGQFQHSLEAGVEASPHILRGRAGGGDGLRGNGDTAAERRGEGAAAIVH